MYHVDLRVAKPPLITFRSMSVTWLLNFCILTTNHWIVAVCSSASLRDILGRKRTGGRCEPEMTILRWIILHSVVSALVGIRGQLISCLIRTQVIVAWLSTIGVEANGYVGDESPWFYDELLGACS
jgi:hypothetical protein